MQYWGMTLSGQPLLSGHFSKSREWPLNRGRTVVVVSLLFSSLFSFKSIKAKLPLLGLCSELVKLTFRASTLRPRKA